MTLKWMTVLIAVCIAAPAPAQWRPRSWYTPSADQLAQAVVKALSQRGVAISAGQVSLLSKIAATEPSPELDVRSIATLDSRSSGEAGRRSTVKLVCHERSACLPFYAIVLWTARTAEGEANTSPAISFEKAMNKPSAPDVMRPGANATMLMEDDRTHIQMPVISLEGGPAGRTIRVQTRDRKRTYSAEIVSADTVKGGF